MVYWSPSTDNKGQPLAHLEEAIARQTSAGTQQASQSNTPYRGESTYFHGHRNVRVPLYRRRGAENNDMWSNGAQSS
jgi:hypothetical protein